MCLMKGVHARCGCTWLSGEINLALVITASNHKGLTWILQKVSKVILCNLTVFKEV